jgi:hypothetical protein
MMDDHGVSAWVLVAFFFHMCMLAHTHTLTLNNNMLHFMHYFIHAGKTIVATYNLDNVNGHSQKKKISRNASTVYIATLVFSKYTSHTEIISSSKVKGMKNKK